MHRKPEAAAPVRAALSRPGRGGYSLPRLGRGTWDLAARIGFIVALCSLLAISVMAVVWAVEFTTPNGAAAPASTAAASSTLPLVSVAAGSSSAAETTTEVYVVQPGDTLTSIAARFYGDASLWPHVHEANRDRISDVDNLQIGTELRIPGRPSD